ncbi:hypothetical protein ACTVZO_03425 [Streptomyces sp. IBSNAI002]|uniref:hypothetical protein n=1 Tax=Streptomyces sp. IBSNAI002 TaxID=3457500 RepID=UPI003FD4FEEB
MAGPPGLAQGYQVSAGAAVPVRAAAGAAAVAVSAVAAVTAASARIRVLRG